MPCKPWNSLPVECQLRVIYLPSDQVGQDHLCVPWSPGRNMMKLWLNQRIGWAAERQRAAKTPWVIPSSACGLAFCFPPMSGYQAWVEENKGRKARSRKERRSSLWGPALRGDMTIKSAHFMALKPWNMGSVLTIVYRNPSSVLCITQTVKRYHDSHTCQSDIEDTSPWPFSTQGAQWTHRIKLPPGCICQASLWFHLLMTWADDNTTRKQKALAGGRPRRTPS